MWVRAAKMCDRLEEAVTLFCFSVMSLFVGLQLFFRFVLNNPLFFPEEVSRYAYVWITFIGLSLSTKTREHIRVDLFVSYLPGWLRRWVEAAVHLVCLAALLGLTVLGIRFLEFSRMSISPALEVPLNLVYVSLPLGCLLAAVRLSRILIADLQGRRGEPATP
jgi:TRAP-type C4-dicarboxylate transport system permease small subunit